MYPTLSCAGVGLYANFDSGIESNACAMLRCIAAIRLRNAVVMGLAGGVADGCWAARAIGATSASIAKRVSLIRTPVGMAKDCYTARESGFPQSTPIAKCTAFAGAVSITRGDSALNADLNGRCRSSNVAGQRSHHRRLSGAGCSSRKNADELRFAAPRRWLLVPLRIASQPH